MGTLDTSMRKQNMKRAGKPVENMYDPPGDEPDGPGPDEVEGDYTQSPVAPKKAAPNVAIDTAVGSTTKVPDTRAAMNRDLMAKAPRKGGTTKPAPVASAPKPDPNAAIRADLLANKRADDAARAAAEKKRMDAEEFSKKLKSTTKRGASGGSGYEAYKSLMGE